MEVKSTGSNRIDDRHRDALLKESGTLGHKRSAIFWAVLVRRTDDLYRGYQPAMPLGV